MEQPTATISSMSEWSNELVNRFAARLRERRAELGLSAQELSDRTEQLGHPVSRTAIADYELGRRKDRLVLGDALALAGALRMPFSALLYPHMPDGEVEALPGVTTTSMAATRALIGVGGEHVETGLDDDENRHEYTSGVALYPLSLEIMQLRASIDKIRAMMQDEPVRSDVELFQNALEKIDEYQADITRTAEIVRRMGGVVEDV